MFKIIYLKTTQYLLHWAIPYIAIFYPPINKYCTETRTHLQKRRNFRLLLFGDACKLVNLGKIYCIRTEDIKKANKQICIVANFARSAYRHHVKYFFFQTTSLKETHRAALFLNWLCWKIQIKRSRNHGLLLHPIILGSCTRLNKNDTDWIF